MLNFERSPAIVSICWVVRLRIKNDYIASLVGLVDLCYEFVSGK